MLDTKQKKFAEISGHAIRRSKSWKDIAEEFNVHLSTVSKRLKAIGVIQKKNHWDPRRNPFMTSEILVQRQQRVLFTEQSSAIKVSQDL